MAGKRPKFIDSPYYENGELKPGAPEEIVKEYNEFMESDEAEDVYTVPKLTAADLE
jgi:hypothetical protein